MVRQKIGSSKKRQHWVLILAVALGLSTIVVYSIIIESILISDVTNIRDDVTNIRDHDAITDAIAGFDKTIEEEAFDGEVGNNEEEEGTISKKRNEISTALMVAQQDKNETKEEPLIANITNEESATNNDSNSEIDIDIDIDIDTTSDESSSYLTMYGEHRVTESLASLPQWLQDYVKWNRNATRSRETAKYLVVVCEHKGTCGGVSDRLRLLPFFLFAAKHTSRVLCFHWKFPYPLESFLEPTELGIDWRCPSEVTKNRRIKRFSWNERSGNSCNNSTCLQEVIESVRNEEDTYLKSDSPRGDEVVTSLISIVQHHSYANSMPDLTGGSKTPHLEMISDIFRVMFKPVKRLAQHINSTMNRLNLVENEYVSVHVRARYPPLPTFAKIEKESNTKDHKPTVFYKREDMAFGSNEKKYIVPILENALKCGNLLAPDLPIYFVSDHHNVTQYALSNDFIGKDGKSFRPVGPDSDVIPMHSDTNIDHFDDGEINFYPIFEDLLIMGGSRCVAHGVGGFGSFGAGLCGNRCRAIHRLTRSGSHGCPNNLGDRKSVPIDESNMMFGEISGGEGKLRFVDQFE